MNYDARARAAHAYENPRTRASANETFVQRVQRIRATARETLKQECRQERQKKVDELVKFTTRETRLAWYDSLCSFLGQQMPEDANAGTEWEVSADEWLNPTSSHFISPFKKTVAQVSDESRIAITEWPLLLRVLMIQIVNGTNTGKAYLGMDISYNKHASFHLGSFRATHAVLTVKD